MPNARQQPPAFQPGQMVCMRTDRAKRGVISGQPVRGPVGWQHKVFFGDHERYVAESDLQLVEDPADSPDDIRFGSLADLLRHLVLTKLDSPQTDALYAYQASRTQFEAYQFKPCLKFLRNPDQRLLIADEVGLGKTIEAGIIYLELKARIDVARVLVVCPSGLRVKWRDELRSRFDENFAILDRTGIEDFIRGYTTYQAGERLKAIVSLEAIRRSEISEALLAAQTRFDLVIIDEAHHCRNSDTLSNAVARRLSSLADAMLLLTATPINLGDENLFQLLHILSPEEFDNYAVFSARLEPNRFVNAAARQLEAGRIAQAKSELVKVEATSERDRFRGNPFYKDILESLSQPLLSMPELVAAQRRLLDLNTLASIFTRTKKRDVMHTGVPTRAAFNLRVVFTQAERRFYNQVLSYVRGRYQVITGSQWVPAWAVMMRARQAASCISAMRDRLAQEVEAAYEPSAEDDADYQEIFTDEDTEERHEQVDEGLAGLLRAAKAVGETDTKFDIFYKGLKQVLDQDAAAGKTSKVLVFSFFKGTLAYLFKRLRRLNVRTELIHGDIAVPERQKIVDDFRTQPEIQVLLSSEVGAEGLDFQFSDTLFNYDLPWNPMKVEQRIGRIDRFGQASPRIRIYNLVVDGTIEDRIFLRLFERIRIFEEAIGDLEAILGEEIRSLSKQIFQPNLTDHEERRLVERSAVAIETRKRELEEFDQQRLSFMGQDKILNQEVDETIASGRFVSEAEVHGLVATFIQKRFGRRLEHNGDSTYALRIESDMVQHLVQFCARAMPADQTAAEFIRRLHAQDILRITFNSPLAYERKLLEFVTLRHPLARAAVEFWQLQPPNGLPMASAVVRAEPQWAGEYFFFVYLFEIAAAEAKTSLSAYVVSQADLRLVPELSQRFLRLVQEAYPPSNDMRLFLDASRRSSFDQARALVDTAAAAEHESQAEEVERLNAALVSARLAALNQTYKLKIKRVEDTMQKVRERRILRMYEGQLEGIKARHHAKTDEISRQREVVVTHRPVLAGLARVIGSEANTRRRK